MSDIIPGVSLSLLCFPDITGATQNIWGTVAFGYGLNYTTGGIPFGLMALADSLTVNWDGFLLCEVWDEQTAGSTFYTFRYVAAASLNPDIPAIDKLQILQTNSAGATTELANGAALPTALLTDSSVLFKAVFNRTEMLG